MSDEDIEETEETGEVSAWNTILLLSVSIALIVAMAVVVLCLGGVGFKIVRGFWNLIGII
jgi:hypothetical protein